MHYLNPYELKAYVMGLCTARDRAKRYKSVDMTNYIGELDELIDAAESVNGYKEFITKLESEKLKR